METTGRSNSQSNLKMVGPLQPGDEHAIAGQLALELLHDIRNPLEALSHLTYLALQEADDPARVRKYMLLAEEQIAILGQFARQTLSLSKPSSVPRSSDLVRLAEAALRIHQRTIDSRRIHLVKSLPENLMAEVHSGEMLRVISNLIVNALDALPEEGTLNLRLHKCHGKVHLVIADNGHGIAEEHRQSIFDPHFTTKGDAGTGLGLASSKRIIENHKGTIRLRSSVIPGKSGSTFRICLPA
ncbi:sensor histidine kinase [Granulicella sibirica]|uniref:histidine kinase n=1 Tax=Granulicella sibirica TaxID=2479048 RepID=A0A4V1L526_9BACT|nr:ATP-binding protein [Granulicella sibirica]RXH54294.1 histidine kinase sensor protein [Granulicella sibirica]